MFSDIVLLIDCPVFCCDELKLQWSLLLDTNLVMEKSPFLDKSVIQSNMINCWLKKKEKIKFSLIRQAIQCTHTHTAIFNGLILHHMIFSYARSITILMKGSIFFLFSGYHIREQLLQFGC